MRKPKLRELKEAFTSLFSKPYTTKFPYQPHVPSKRFRGRPKFDEEKCMGCGGCASVCPSDAIEVKDIVENKSGKRILTHFPDKCIFCGQCEANCPVEGKGIRLTKEFDISYFDKKEVENSVEHELVICESCGSVIGPKKQILWIAEKLGNLAFSQPVLITQIIQNLNILTEVEEKVVPPIQRTDILKVICPKCRRQAFISDERKEKK